MPEQVAFGIEPAGLFDVGTIAIEGAGGWGWVNNESSSSPASSTSRNRSLAPQPSSLSNGGLVRIMRPRSGANASSGRYGSGSTQSYGGTQGVACHAVDIRDATSSVFPGRHNFALVAPVAASRSSAFWPPNISQGRPIDGIPRHQITCSRNGSSLAPRGGHSSIAVAASGVAKAACAVELGSAVLEDSPSLAGQAAYVAVQIRAVPPAHGSVGLAPQGRVGTAVAAQLKIFDGESWLLSSDPTPPLLQADGHWTLITMCAVALPWSGGASFELELTGNATAGGWSVEVGKVTIAQVGTAWGSAIHR